MAIHVGQQLGNYRLIRYLGHGGFADVYLGEHCYLRTHAAIKVLHAQVAQQDVQNFVNEAQTIATLKHPHIVRILDFGVDGHTPFFVMEYASQGTLRTRHPQGSLVPLSTALAYVEQVASALQHAHDRRIVHRDVKPENMLVASDGSIWLSDFGIAVLAHTTQSMSTQATAGTFAYMPPEQIQGKAGPASDQYSLAVLLYEWLAGSRPFVGTPVEVAMQHAMTPPPSLVGQVPGVSRIVEDVLFKALAKDPRDRYASMQTFVTALQQTSAPPPMRQFMPPGVDRQPPQAPFPIMPPPGVISPTFSTTPMAQEPVGPLVKPFTNPAAQKTVLPPTPRDALVNISTILPGQTAERPSPRPRRLSKGYVALLLGMVLLLLGGGLLAFSVVRSSSLKSMQATATAGAQRAATATAIAAPTATVVAAFNAYQTGVATDGIMFGFNAQHTRVNPYEHILNIANVSGLKQKWAAPTGGSVYASPAVANGIVYAGSNDDKLYAFDAQTGTQKWIALTGGYIYASPAVVNGVVYISSSDDKLYAFDAQTGLPKWAAPTGGLINSSPVVANGMVYVGSNDDKLYAFDAQTGTQKWTAPTGNSIDFSSPAVANGMVYVGSNDDKLHAFDAQTGTQKWVSPTGANITSSPAVVDGMVYIGSKDDRLHAFDAQTGAPKWTSAPTNSAIVSSPAVTNGVVYVGSDDDRLYAFNAATGVIKWISPPTGDAIVSCPLVANGVVYVGSYDHKLYAFDAATGMPKWASPFTGGQIESSPAVVNGIVYVGSDDNNLYAFSL